MWLLTEVTRRMSSLIAFNFFDHFPSYSFSQKGSSTHGIDRTPGPEFPQYSDPEEGRKKEEMNEIWVVFLLFLPLPCSGSHQIATHLYSQPHTLSKWLNLIMTFSFRNLETASIPPAYWQ